MARHASRDGMDAKVDLATVVLEELGELFHHVLGLGNRHAVTRNDGHVGRRFQYVVGVFHGDRLDLALDHGLLVRDAGKAREQHVGERAVHRLTHDLGQDDARGTDQ